MRFFLELVSCCGSANQCAAIERTSSEPRSEETSTLVSAVRNHRRKKRGRTGPTAARAWRPSLGSISEDNAHALSQREFSRSGVVGSEREVKRKSAAASAAKVRSRSYDDDFGRHSVSTVIPAFSPTPFVF
ncbi:hypothetical protein L6164_018550 [Bauhinia variegata]|uniref:Uncharacterized protein n=1 Tax=Bauhinia variegata TaxID=167791 RepID=A0ACB9NBM9_BAUVA|nr:hypothetical protein L6164_018550 [Bauhinia variegata]